MERSKGGRTAGIQTVLEEVTLDINNGKENFVRISEEEMPEVLKFMEQQNNFSEWAFIGQGRKLKDEGEEEVKKEENEAQEVEPTEEESLSSSMFLRNFEEQMRIVREQRENHWKENKATQPLSEEIKTINEGEKEPFEGPIEEPQVPLEELQWKTEEGIPFSSRDDLEGELADWVWVEEPTNDTTGCQDIVPTTHAIVPQRPGFFENWPSFGVYDKMKVVVTATGGAFCFGFVMGAQMAMQSIYRLIETPAVAGGVGLAAALACYLNPMFVVTAIEYVVLGGVVFGTSVAVPVLVVGTGGVFVGASVYHAYVAAKRGAGRMLDKALTPPSPPCCIDQQH